MLIDKGVAVGEVVTIKLTSGEEIIGKLEDESADCHIKMSKPMVVAMGQQGPGLMPYLFTVNPDKTVKISRSVLVIMEATDKSFADAYIQNTTGIKLAL
jgi:hypothetical protein